MQGLRSDPYKSPCVGSTSSLAYQKSGPELISAKHMAMVKTPFNGIM